MPSEKEHLDINMLETWLWDAACAIRGATDAPLVLRHFQPGALIFWVSCGYCRLNGRRKVFKNSSCACWLARDGRDVVWAYASHVA